MSGVPDTVVAPVWITTNVLLGWCGWAVSRRLFPAEALGPRVGHVILFGWAVVAAVCLALGSVGALRPAALVIGVGGVSLGALAVVRRRGADVPAPSTAWRAAGGWAVVWGLGVVYLAAHTVAGGVFQFPTDRDSLLYHLPYVDYWVQTGSLYVPVGCRWSDPANGELVTLWLTAPFSGDFLFGLTNLPHTILLAVWAVELARRAGGSRLTSNLAGLAAVSNAVVHRQLTDAGNDVAMTAAFLACLGHAARYAAAGRAGDLGFAAVAFGLLVGVKFFALGYAAVAGAVALGLVCRLRGCRAAARAAGAGVAGAVLLGVYWYARNWAATGNPLYPLGAPPAPGVSGLSLPVLWATTLLGNGSLGLPRLAASAVWAVTGPVHLVAAFLSPLWVGWLAVRRAPVGVAVAAAVVGTGSVWLVTPFVVEDVPGTLNHIRWGYGPVRYGLCFLTTAVVGLAAALGEAGRAFERAAGPAPAVVRACLGMAGAAAVAYQMFAPAARRDYWVPVGAADLALCTATLLVLVFLGIAVWAAVPRCRVAAGLLALTVGGTIAIDRLADRWHRAYIPFYDALLGGGLLTCVAEEVPPGGWVCVQDFHPYPFLGPARQYRVCQPPLDGQSYPDWADYLRDRSVGLLVCGPKEPGGGWDHTRAWLATHPELFRPVRVPGSHYSVYRVNRGFSTHVRPDTSPKE
jgi:hypothetical protein